MTEAHAHSFVQRPLDRAAASMPLAGRLERTKGSARVAIDFAAGQSRLRTLYQAGSAKVRLPRRRAEAPIEAVILNTAGGLTGGDCLDTDVSVGAMASAVVTSQAAERIYRSADGVATVTTGLQVGDGARLDWLPQETIIFDGAALVRQLTADVAAGGSLLAIETLVFGRAAMGEAVRRLALFDSWRIRRAGRLAFADGIRIDGDATAILSAAATGNGAAAVATALLVAPDAESRLPAARSALTGTHGEADASAWNGILVARFVAASGQALRHDLIRLVDALRQRPMPRVWYC